MALVIALATAALLVTRSGLLSADAPEQPDRRSGRPAEPPPAAARLVGELNGRLVRLGQDGWDDGARVPGSDPVALFPVPVPAAVFARGPGTLAGVADGVLFVLGTGPGSAAALIGAARSVVAAPPGRLLVWRGERVVELDAGTGRVLDATPFPGFDSSDGWSPEGLVAVTGTHPLLMSRPLPDGLRQQLALAWPSRRVEPGSDPAVQVLGTFGTLLGIADDWVLVEGDGCPGPGCVVQVVSVTRDDVLVRVVAPPDGWKFVRGPVAGRTREALLPVMPRGSAKAGALARVVPGGDSALVVGGSEGVDLGTGVVDTPDGTVYLVVREPAEGAGQLRIWDPERSGRAEPAPGGFRVPRNTRLVCVCG